MESSQKPLSFEIGPIRPPSEAYSLLIRATRNCPWNKCKFCHTYKGKKFELRSVDEIVADIAAAKAMRDRLAEIARKTGVDLREIAGRVLNDPPSEAFRNVALWLASGGANVFLQDANSLVMKTDELATVIRLLKEAFPGVKRITSYARSQTADRKKLEELYKLHDAGLSRLHLGLESGHDPLLKYMNKGVTSEEHISGGKKVVLSGISLSEYVILGLGGKEMSEEHAVDTARVLNEIKPDFIRVRTLCINKNMPLNEDVVTAKFVRATDEEIIREEKSLIENLSCKANFVSDHISNLLPEIEGKLPEDKDRMLACIEQFEALSADEKANFIIGRRINIYTSLKDMTDWGRHDIAEHVRQKLGYNKDLEQRIIFSRMEEFI